MNKELKYFTTAVFAVGIHATSLCTEVTGSSKQHQLSEIYPIMHNSSMPETKPFFNKNILHGVLTAEQPDVDVLFMGLVQEFAEIQIELEPEFMTVLNNLTFKAGKKAFKTKRF